MICFVFVCCFVLFGGRLPFYVLSIASSLVSSTSLKGFRNKPAADMDKNHPKSKSWENLHRHQHTSLSYSAQK